MYYFWVIGMTWPGIAPWFPGSLVNSNEIIAYNSGVDVLYLTQILFFSSSAIKLNLEERKEFVPQNFFRNSEKKINYYVFFWFSC